jgi:hypothetical protein
MPIKGGVGYQLVTAGGEGNSKAESTFRQGSNSFKKSKEISEKGFELKDMTYEVVVYCDEVIKYVYYNVPFCKIGELLLSAKLCDKAHLAINEEDERNSYLT